MKILIAGHGKSGTSALFHSIAPLMPEDTRSEFEPLFWIPKEDDPPNALAKITLSSHLVPSRPGDFSTWDKKILIFRDYRDVIVSSTMYSMFVHATIRPCGYPHVDPIQDLLEKKEKDPASVNFSEVVDMMIDITERDLWDVFDYGPRRVMKFKEDFKPFLVRYEDYVSGNHIKELEAYLSLAPIDHRPQLKGVLKRLGRTKSLGDWRNWFTPADVERFSPIANPINEAFGYSLDWELPEKPEPDPKYGSKYVAGVLKHESQQGY